MILYSKNLTNVTSYTTPNNTCSTQPAYTKKICAQHNKQRGQCRALAAAAQPQLQCRACVVQGLWQQQRRALAAAAQLDSSRAGLWQRQRSSGQCRALEAAAQQRAVQGIGSGGSAAAVQGGSAGCWQRQHSRSCSAGPALCRAFVSGSAGSWQRQHNWASQRRQSSSNSTSALGPKRADVDGESILQGGGETKSLPS